MSRDIVDDVLAIGSVFDWITPVAAIITTLLKGGGTTMSVSVSATGYGPNEVKAILREDGIDCWGVQWVDDRVIFVVRPDDVNLAQQALLGPDGYRDSSGGGLDMIVVVLLLGALAGLTGYLWWMGVI